ncbi:hypothetical protein FRC08_007010 [Ceratobasidium sp. 394]|nr:hypothetical protein FRC08_007010 [Ceratobasidium sp. 394]
MKCVFGTGQTICQRCLNSNRTCIVGGRRPEGSLNTREQLMRELADQDQLIETLLRRTHNQTPEHPPSHDISALVEWVRRNNRTMLADSSHQVEQSKTSAYSPSARPGATAPDPEVSTANTREPRADNRKYDRPRSPAGPQQDSVEFGDTPQPPQLLATAASSHIRRVHNIARDRPRGIANSEDEEHEEHDWAKERSEPYFEAGPSADPELKTNKRHAPPEILAHRIIKPAEVEELFEIFFEKLNASPFIGILDPSIHTPAFLSSQCPFLFTTICGVSSRYYQKGRRLYPVMMHFAEQSAMTVLADRRESVGAIQAFMLLSAHPVPTHLREEDRTQIYLDLAARMAVGLYLHQPWQGKGTGEVDEREMVNRTRTWLILFNMDRSGTVQLGWPAMLGENDIVRRSHDWYKLSPYNIPTDIHLTAYTRLRYIMGQFLTHVPADLNSPMALNKSSDLVTITTHTDGLFTALEHETQKRFEESDHSSALFHG